MFDLLINLLLYFHVMSGCLDGISTQTLGSHDKQNLTPIISRHMGKPTIYIAENKGADQLRSDLVGIQIAGFLTHRLII